VRGTANLLPQLNVSDWTAATIGEVWTMKLEEHKANKKRSNFFLTADARIIDAKVGELGISKSGVVEVALRKLNNKAIDNDTKQLPQ
jgi:hypothetical protein